jgi:hypothetical protein
MQDWEVKQEKAGEAGIVKTYITNDETSLWILNRCGTDIRDSILYICVLCDGQAGVEQFAVV